jgi:hypothetical protein
MKSTAQENILGAVADENAAELALPGRIALPP